MWMLSLMTCARWMPLSRLLAPQRALHCRANAPRLVPFMHTHHFNLHLSLFCSLSLSLTHKRRAERHTRRGGCTSQTHTHTHTHARRAARQTRRGKCSSFRALLHIYMALPTRTHTLPTLRHILCSVHELCICYNTSPNTPFPRYHIRISL